MNSETVILIYGVIAAALAGFCFVNFSEGLGFKIRIGDRTEHWFRMALFFSCLTFCFFVFKDIQYQKKISQFWASLPFFVSLMRSLFFTYTPNDVPTPQEMS